MVAQVAEAPKAVTGGIPAQKRPFAGRTARLGLGSDAGAGTTRPGVLRQSLYGSNSSAPAMATPTGVRVCKTFTDARWKCSTSGSRL